ncbi:unnamed protein product, partial [Musa acuminata var. zebrina]
MRDEGENGVVFIRVTLMRLRKEQRKRYISLKFQETVEWCGHKVYNSR